MPDMKPPHTPFDRLTLWCRAAAVGVRAVTRTTCGISVRTVGLAACLVVGVPDAGADAGVDATPDAGTDATADVEADATAVVLDTVIQTPENPAPRLPEEVPPEFDTVPGDNPLADANGYLILGLANRPEWIGANASPESLFLISRFGLPGVEMSLEGLDWFADFLPSSIWRAGLTATFETGRDAIVEDNDNSNANNDSGLDDVPSLGFSSSLGGFIGIEKPSSLLPEGLASARVSARTALGSARSGTSLTADVDYFFAANFMWRIGVAARATLADDDWVDSRFGVSASDAAATGLPEFNASGGLVSVGGSIYTIVSLSPRLGVFGRFARTLLLDDAADSPIVSRFGDDQQRFAGIGLFYLF